MKDNSVRNFAAGTVREGISTPLTGIMNRLRATKNNIDESN
jgi:hypothetical protein